MGLHDYSGIDSAGLLCEECLGISFKFIISGSQGNFIDAITVTAND